MARALALTLLFACEGPFFGGEEAPAPYDIPQAPFVNGERRDPSALLGVWRVRQVVRTTNGGAREVLTPTAETTWELMSDYRILMRGVSDFDGTFSYTSEGLFVVGDRVLDFIVEDVSPTELRVRSVSDYRGVHVETRSVLDRVPE